MGRNIEKFKIYEEAAKSRQTTHWDMDYMPAEDIDALYAAGKKTTQRRKWIILLGCIVSLIVASGVIYSVLRAFFL